MRFDPALESVRQVINSPAQALHADTRAKYEPRFGHDFSAVRVHADRDAALSASSLNAEAWTLGRHIAFRHGRYRPDTAEGQELIAHELVHVLQQGEGEVPSFNVIRSDSSELQAHDTARAISRGESLRSNVATRGPGVQLKVSPEDVSSEMLGRQFTLTEANGQLAAGDVVVVVSWSNSSDTIVVANPKLTGGNAAVPKRVIRPLRTAVPGIAPYDAGVHGQAQSVIQNEDKLSKWAAKEPAYKTDVQRAAFQGEKSRLEGLLTKRRHALNRKLIQETMFNRFDQLIAQEVAAANQTHRLKGKDALDPNLVKSMLFQESQIGTSGAHLQIAPTHPVKTRFNVGQVIDSSGNALLHHFEHEQVAVLVSNGLNGLRSDLTNAQRELGELTNKASRTPAEDIRLATLKSQSVGSWETFIWNYRSPTTGRTFTDVVNTYFASSVPAKNDDYAFWIHMTVTWLFTKWRPGSSWEDVIRAYNGSGPNARKYRDEVVARAAGAKSAGTAHKLFIPGEI